jgi:membrane-bound serine protease (ClpP class)
MQAWYSRLTRIVFLFGLMVMMSGPTTAEGASAATGRISRIVLKGSVNPGSAGYFSRALAEAAGGGDRMLLVELDTPGGLVTSLRSMVQEILASRIPVVVYVAPSGAQAASAGALLVLSAHVAAMSPGTEVGAAHPVGFGGGSTNDSVSGKKLENDLAAYARSLAHVRGRNADWAERAVRESIASPAHEALQAGVIDTVVRNRAELFSFLDGRKVTTAAGPVILNTAAVTVREIRPSLSETVKMTIADPNLAYIFFLLGIAGIYFELASPGAGFPGVAGAISLLLGLYAMQLLSADTTGLLLLVLAVIFLVLELFVTSGGVLAAAGLAALFLGSLMLFNTPETGISLSLWVFLPVFLSFTGAVILIVWVVARASANRRILGEEAMIGETGRVIQAIGPGSRGKVYVHGEIWDAVSSEVLAPETPVSVTAIEGMKLQVKQKKEL